jgi:hypothetical protein
VFDLRFRLVRDRRSWSRLAVPLICLLLAATACRGDGGSSHPGTTLAAPAVPAPEDTVPTAPTVTAPTVTEPTVPASPQEPDGPGPAEPDGELKPLLAGLLDRQGQPRRANWDTLNGLVVDVPWADVQPQAFGPLAPNNAIDQAIAFVRNGPTNFRIKIRVKAGIYAPDSVRASSGGEARLAYDGYDSLEGKVGLFWTSRFGDAYVDLQTKLARSYDLVPEIGQVVITRCMTFYAEPFLRQAGTKGTPQALLAAGYTVAADKTCHAEAIAAHKVWTHTRSSLAFNPYQEILPDGNTQSDTEFPIEMMHYCREVLGPRCVLENYSLAWPLRAGGEGNYQAIYDALKAAGPPLAFQTAAESRVGDWAAATRWAAGIGASSIELNRSYPNYDRSTLVALGALLVENS